MPKLFQINTTIGRGSTGRIAELISSQARKAGWECYIAHGPRYMGNSEMLSYKVSGNFDELRHFFLSRVFDRHGLGSCSATNKLIERIEEVQPNVVQIHNIHGYYANYKLLFQYLAKKGIPTVMTMHDFWLMTGHCAYINKSCSKWETNCGHCPRLGEYPASVFDRTKKNWTLKKELFDAFDKDKLVLVPVSYWLERFVKQSLLSECQTYVIQNGINTKVFQPYRGEHSELWRKVDWSKYTIISVADRWTEANGFNDIVQLSQMLSEDMQIVMVGLNEQQLQNLPEKIVGIGHTDNVQQLVELYTSADVLFNSSTEVTFGLVTAEAMACGTPAIVFKDTAGEEIIDGETGYAIERIEEISNLVYACREKSDAYKDSCRKRIVECFDSEKQYSKYIELYDDILKKAQ
jgi:glycosyltransferase involved in cell wall biosynthesis